MASLADKEDSEGVSAAVHLLLAGPSKVGKTDFVADFILDGGTVLYVDNDNGLNTIYRRLRGNKEALARCLYIETQNLYQFMTYMFAGRAILQWNETKDGLFSPKSAADDDKITEIRIKDIPHGVVLVFDSWTSASLGLLRDAAANNGVSFETFNEGGQAAYGDASRRANLLCTHIQRFPGHVILQAHVDFYERMEKPKGVNSAKGKDMIIKENVQIPSSVSRPHGFTMAKYFNEFGWMKISPTGAFKLDYRQMPDRVGGGSLMAEGDPKKELRLSKTLIEPREVAGGWIRTLSAAELKSEVVASTPPTTANVKATPTTANSSAPAAPTLPGAGAKPKMFSLGNK
jgi:hypothetical protein